MATVVKVTVLSRLRTEPLRGPMLAAVTLIAWLTGAFYCSGYELFSKGINTWPECLIWSTFGVLPWLALFEWSKSREGRRITAAPVNLAAMLAGTAIVSLAMEALMALAEGESATPLALALLRRLPAAGISFVLILWARQDGSPAAAREPDLTLAALAPTIDWVSAADNYVELHIGGRVMMRRMTLAEAELALSDRGFVRIHRRYLVNRDRIAAVRGNGEKVVRLADGAELPVGKRFATNLLAA
jgi:hypothetical protein